jgi:dihydroorotate dehydrogenase electron transfer subunit
MIKNPQRCAIVEHVEIASQTMRLVVEAPDVAQSAVPGQFAHILCGLSYDPLLRRPISIHDADADQGLVSFLYEIRGRGTALLAEKGVGDVVDLIAPLGNGFTLPTSPKQRVALVGGGIGVAPLRFLARRISEVVPSSPISVMVGAQTLDRLLCREEFADVCCDLGISTDDGSSGTCGFVTDLLSNYLNAHDGEPPIIYACGPYPMLARIASITKDFQVNCQVSLEARMACGVGACMSCVVKVKSGDAFKYVRCCKEGPVFDASEVVWK